MSKFARSFAAVYVFQFLSSFSQAAVNTTPRGNLDHARQLTSAFERLCPSQGSWTHNAVAAARSLETMLQGIKDDPNCQSLASSLQSVRSLQTALDRHLQNGESSAQIMADRRERHEILLQMQNSPDPATQQELASALRRIEIQIARGEETQDRNQSHQRDRLATQHLVVSMQTVLTQSLNHKQCFLGKPQIFSDLAALAGSIGAVLVSGGLSLAVGAGVELIGSAVEYSRKASLVSKIRKIDEAGIHSAFSCALEALSNQWCAATEMNRLVNLRARSDDLDDDFSEGLKLLDRDASVFFEWLEQVRTGVRPSNSGQADLQRMYYAKETALRSFEVSAYSVLSEYELKLGDATSDEERFRTVRKAVSELKNFAVPAVVYPSDGAPNPVFEIVDDAEFGWRLVGVMEPPSYGDDAAASGIIDFFTYPIKDIREKYPDVYAISLKKIEDNTRGLIGSARSRLSGERMRVLQPDPRIILWDVETEVNVGTIRGSSPLESLGNVLRYLEDGLEDQKKDISGNRRIVYDTTIERLRNIQNYIQTALVLSPPRTMVAENPAERLADDQAREALKKIYEEAVLEHGRSFFESRIHRIVRDRLTRWILDPEQGSVDAITASQLLAAQDIVDEYKSVGRTSIVLLQEDLHESLPIIRKVTQGFAEVFVDNLKKTLLFHTQNLEKNPRDIASRKSVQKTCLLLLAVPDWQAKEFRKFPLHLCEGARRDSMFPGGSSSYVVTADAFKLVDHADRACHYRNFLRSEKIREYFGSAGD